MTPKELRKFALLVEFAGKTAGRNVKRHWHASILFQQLAAIYRREALLSTWCPFTRKALVSGAKFALECSRVHRALAVSYNGRAIA